MDRERVTITLRQDLLKKIDRLVDGVRVRNRSHAVEGILSRNLGVQPRTAVILAGGRGLKMRPFTDEMPKSMFPVHDKPILEHILLQLRDQGIQRVILLLGHLGEKIERYFGDGTRLGLELSYIREKTAQGTAGALRLVKPVLNEEAFYLLHGDVLAQLDLVALADFHAEHGRAMTMALTSVADPTAYGAVRMSGINVVDFQEKPAEDLRVSRLINAGVYVLGASVLSHIPTTGKSYVETDIIPKLIAQRELAGYVFEGKWFDISTPETYARALREW